MKIKLVYYLKENKEFKGRLLGLLSEEQFANLYVDPKNLAKKISTCASANLTMIADTDLKKRRLVMTFIENHQVKLLITRPIDYMYNCIYTEEKVDNLSLVDNNDNWLTLTKA